MPFGRRDRVPSCNQRVFARVAVYEDSNDCVYFLDC